MKATLLILACLAFLATSAWAEEEKVEISERNLPTITDAQHDCIMSKLRPSKAVGQAVNKCITDNKAPIKKAGCIKNIEALKSCF